MLVTAAAVILVSVVFLALVRGVTSGTDRASQLAPLLNFVGVDRYYALARACGAAAAVLATVSVAGGLHAAESRRKGRPVPRWLARGHRQVSLATVLLVLAHATVPYLSEFSPYGGWATALLPFRQPASWGTRGALGESLGIIAVYLMIVLGPTFYLVRGAGRARWAWVHRLSFLAYLAAVAHVFLMGSDVLVAGPVRATLLLLQAAIAAQLGRRIGWQRTPARLMSGAAFLGSLFLCVAGTAGLAGAAVGGLVVGGPLPGR